MSENMCMCEKELSCFKDGWKTDQRDQAQGVWESVYDDQNSGVSSGLWEVSYEVNYDMGPWGHGHWGSGMSILATKVLDILAWAHDEHEEM